MLSIKPGYLYLWPITGDASPTLIKIKELVESGVIGAPRLVYIKLFKPTLKKRLKKDDLPWRFKPDISGGGLFVDLGSHQLDFLDYLFGPIVSVNAFAAKPGRVISC